MNTTAVTIFSSSFKSLQPLACRIFESAIERSRIANAYLLVGRASEDKLTLAIQIACHFNCQSEGRPQGSCVARGTPVSNYCLNCQWITSNQHPQAWLTLAGEGKSQKIPVEKARQLTDELAKTSSFVRVIVVPQSDEVTFHRPAANALLKCIEEPPADCLFFFFADSTDDVLATIVSRCQVVPLQKSLTLGYWQTVAGDDARKQAQTRLDAGRAAFIMQSRRYFGSASTPGPFVKGVVEGLEVSRQMLELCKELSEVIEEHEAAESVIDLFCASELEVLSSESPNSEKATSYLSKLFDLAERTKRHINQYVKQANAIESFGLALNELRHEFSGEISLAKR